MLVGQRTTIRCSNNHEPPKQNSANQIIFTKSPKTFKVYFGEIKVHSGGIKVYFGGVKVYFWGIKVYFGGIKVYF